MKNENDLVTRKNTKIRSLHEKIKDENIGIEVIAIVNDKYASI